MFSRVKPLSLLCCTKTALFDALETPHKAVFVIPVRWRKRRWEPVNANKLFHVPDKTKRALPSDLRAEFMQRHNIYRTQMRAIR